MFTWEFIYGIGGIALAATLANAVSDYRVPHDRIRSHTISDVAEIVQIVVSSAHSTVNPPDLDNPTEQP